MELYNAVKDRILNLAKTNNITLHKVSINSGISYSTLNSFINGKCKSPNLSTILHICEGFNMELKDFFDDDLFKDVEDE